MDLSIIILHFKNIEKTGKCLDSVKSSDLGNLKIETIVVDNGSEDNIADILKNKYPDVVLAQSKVNMGMGPGNNLGIEGARGNFLLLLNDDILLNKSSISAMYKHISKDKSIGVLAPKLVYPDSTFQRSCFRFPNVFTPVLRRTFLGKFFKKYLDEYAMGEAESKEPRECEWIMGSCWIVRRSLIDKIGPFDKRFFYYMEDTDFCRRVWQAGLRVVYLTEVAVIHEHGRRSAQKPWYIAPFTEVTARHHIRSYFKYFWKWRRIMRIRK